MDAFDELIRRFPESDYARDAQLKIDLAHDHLAGKEMEIGRYYQRRKHWLAGINRFRSVVEKYQTTTHVPEALHRLTESYLALGMTGGGAGGGGGAGLQLSRAATGTSAPTPSCEGQNLSPGATRGSWFSRLF